MESPKAAPTDISECARQRARRCCAVQLLLWSGRLRLRRPFPSSAPHTRFGDCDRLRPHCIHSSLPTRPLLADATRCDHIFNAGDEQATMVGGE
jgi:hypothetical protein